MGNEEFYEQRTERSRVKGEIVENYFEAWANVIQGAAKRGGRIPLIGYVDLFCGPGKYDDGTASTPLLVLEKCLKRPQISKYVKIVFNDKNREYVADLERTVSNLPDIHALANFPEFHNTESEEGLLHILNSVSRIPSLYFIDPWGYKGLTSHLLGSALAGWGCDCVFFFNYNRINMAIGNDDFLNHMQALFTEELLDELRVEVKGLKPSKRETVVLQTLEESIKLAGGKLTLPFRIKAANSRKTMQHIILATKDFKGYEMMRDIMSKRSSRIESGVASLEFDSITHGDELQFELISRIDDLESLLLRAFVNQTLSMGEIFKTHSIGKPYIKSNYKEAIRRMEQRELVKCDPEAQLRPMRKGKRTVSDTVVVTFSENKG